MAAEFNEHLFPKLLDCEEIADHLRVERQYPSHFAEGMAHNGLEGEKLALFIFQALILEKLECFERRFLATFEFLAITHPSAAV